MEKQKNDLMWAVILSLAVGVILGYIFAQDRPFGLRYSNNVGSMMRVAGSSMMQMGQMMQNKGRQYNDSDMMQKGQKLEEKGSSMMKRSNGMMGNTKYY